AAAARAVTLSCVIPVSTPAEHQRGQVAGIYYRDDLVAQPFHFEDGCVAVPSGPGMGVEVDEAKIARYRVP
ncbi:MAG TPA: enolase C-terminal domain-like protein, partial [Candidatus Sulfotelmatobacter sp.]|nr:enolase C-terminal domain-like protein [Candidatus Sulfotelmatobacter sp.]